MTTADWQDDARCRDSDPSLFVGDERDEWTAKRICNGTEHWPVCPVRDQCLAYSLETHSHWGVWGGKGQDERREIRKREGRPAAPKQYRAGLPGPRRAS